MKIKTTDIWSLCFQQVQVKTIDNIKYNRFLFKKIRCHSEIWGWMLRYQSLIEIWEFGIILGKGISKGMDLDIFYIDKN